MCIFINPLIPTGTKTDPVFLSILQLRFVNEEKGQQNNLISSSKQRPTFSMSLLMHIVTCLTKNRL